MGGWVRTALLGQQVAAEKYWDDRGDLHEAHSAAAEPYRVRRHKLSPLPTASGRWLTSALGMVAVLGWRRH